jgi:transglutaminase-like putative cysteine protease
MRFQVTHSTVYRYVDPVSISQNIAHLRPRTCPRHNWQHRDLTIDPEPTAISDRSDYFGNQLTFFAIQEAHKMLSVVSTGKVDVSPVEPYAPQLTNSWENVRDSIRLDRSAAGLAALQFVMPSPFVKMSRALSDYAAPPFQQGRPILDAVMDLCHRIHTDFKFDSRATTITTPIDEVLTMRRGVCQDFAHLMIGCMRSRGLAARYISGYLLTNPRPGRPRLVGGDASHDLLVSDKHICIAWGRDFGDVSPIQGVILGGRRHTLAISVDVSPISDVA